MYIILDLDGTLISEPQKASDKIVSRPYLKEFLTFCFKNFECVSIWTAADYGWYSAVYNGILQPILHEIKAEFDFVYTRLNCKVIYDHDPDTPFPESIYIKPLKKLWKKKKGYTKGNTIIIDDTPHTYRMNYGNAIPITTFTGDKDDGALQTMIDILRVKCGLLMEK
jgi:hypothetical protein